MLGNDREKIRLYTRIAITSIILIAGLYIILSQAYQEDYTKWAFGIIGVIVGYWLK